MTRGDPDGIFPLAGSSRNRISLWSINGPLILNTGWFDLTTPHGFFWLQDKSVSDQLTGGCPIRSLLPQDTPPQGRCREISASSPPCSTAVPVIRKAPGRRRSAFGSSTRTASRAPCRSPSGARTQSQPPETLISSREVGRVITLVPIPDP